MDIDDIKKMIEAINQRVESFGRGYQPRYIKDSKWRLYNKDRFDIESYLKASPSRRDVIERDLIKSIELMPTANDLKRKKDIFIENFNTALEKRGLKPAINNQNYIEFKDFTERYNNIITETKYRDSGQIVQLFKEYVKTKNKYNDMEEFFDKLIKRKRD